MAGGTVHLLVLPNAKYFHTKLKEQIKDHKIDPVGVKINPELQKWEYFEKKVDAMDGRKVNLFVDVDSSSAEAILDDLASGDDVISRRVALDTSEAQRQLEEFGKGDPSQGKIHRELDVDFGMAHEELQSFKNQWEDQEIRPKVIIDGLGSPSKDAKEKADEWNEIFEALNRRGGRKISGVRNLVDFDAELIDVENFMGRMMRSMNSQFSIGMRQIYDQYFTTLSKMWKLGSKPFLNLREDWNSAENFSDFFSKVGDRAETTKKKILGFSADARKGFRGVASDIQESGRRIKAVPGEISGAFSELKDALGQRGGIGGNIKAFFPDFKPLQRHIAASAKGIRARMSVDFANIADFVGKHFTSRIKRAFAAVPGAFRAVGRGISNTINKSWDFAKAAGSKVTGLYKVFERMNYGAATAMRTATFATINQVNFLARDVAKGFRAVAGGVEEGVGRIADRTKAIGRVFKNMADIVGMNMRVVGLNIRDGAARVAKPFKYMADTAGIHMRMMGNSVRNGGRLIGRHAKFAASRMGENMRVMGLFARDGMRTVTGSFARGFKRVGSNFAYFGRVVGGFGRNLGRAFGKTARAFAPFAAAGMRAFGAVSSAMTGMLRIVGRMGPVFNAVRTVMGRIGRVAMGASRMAMGAFAKLAGGMMKALMPAIMAVIAGFVAMGGQAVIGAVMALLGALQAVIGGALVMMPALIGAVGVSLAVLKIGAEGLGGAFKAAFSAESVEDFEKAIADLPPAMQSIARSMRGFKPMWDEMTANVQQNMFGGLDDNFADAVGSMLPIFKRGAESMALSWNKSFEGALDALSSPQATSGLEAIMQGAEDMAREMEPVLANLIKAFGSLAEQGAKFLGPVGSWAADKSEDFFNWSEGLKKIDPKTGESFFDGIISSAKKNAALLGDIFGGVFGTLGNVFKAGAVGGGGMLAGMAAGMQELKEYTSEGNEGFEKMVGFMEQATEFASQLGDIVKPLFGGVLSVLTTLSSVGSGAIAGTGELLNSIASGLEGFEELGEAFGENIGNIFAALAPSIESLLVTLQPIVAGLGQGLDNALTPALEAMAPIFEQLESFGEPLGKLLETVGTALGTILAAAMPLLGSFLTILEPLIPILDKVFYYIGEVVGAVIEAITPFFTMRDEAVSGLVEALGPLVDVLGEGLLAVIEALSPLFPILGALFADVVNAVTPLIEPLTKIAFVLFSALIDVINMVMPIVPVIAAHFSSLASTLSDILVIALNWLLDTWEKVWPTVASVLKWVIDKIIVPGIKIASAVINTFAKFIKWAIEKIIVPVLNFLSDVFTKVIDVIKWVIENVAKPAIDGLKKAFSLAVDGITKVWDGLKKIFSKPIQFFIDTVVNDGVIAVWNKVMGWIKQDDKKMGRVSKPAGMNFHQGGVLPGYSVGKDNYNFVETRTGARLGLAGGEGIMRQEFVSAVGGKKGIDRLNNDARHGRLRFSGHDPSVGYAQGGVVGAMEEIVRQKYPEMVLTSGWRESNDNHGRGLAADFAWPGAFGPHPAQLSLANDIADTYPGSMELIYGPGFARQIKNGAIVGDGGGSYGFYAGAGDHSNHVHWAMNTPPTLPFGGGVFEGGSSGAGAGGGGGNWISQAANWLKEKLSFVTNLFGSVKDKLGKQVANVGDYGTLATGTAKNAMSATKDWAKSKLDELNPFKGLFSGSGPLGSREEVEMYRDGIIAAFKRQGEEPLQWRVDALLRQIWTESKGDPNVAQQIVDVNGTGESAGVGLYQVIPTTWAGYRDPELPDDRRNVEAAHNFAVRYFRDKHHWNTGPGGVGLENTGWKDGGVLPQFFDRGGESRGTGLMPKNVISPERVLSPMQTKAFNSFVYQFMPELITQFKRNPREFGRLIGKATAEIKRIHHELREGRIKHIQYGMADMYRRRLNGEKIADNPVDLNFDFEWLKRNQENLLENRDRAARQIGKVYPDPEAYLEAERRAKEQIDKEREEAREAKKKSEEDASKERKEKQDEERKKLDEERKKAEEEDDKAKIAEIDAKIDKLDKSSEDRFEVARRRLDTAEERTREEHTKELQEKIDQLKKDGASDEEIQKVQDKLDETNKKIDKNFEDARKVVDEKEKKEQDRLKKIEEQENERIEKAKADGSYYYGYKTFDDEGKNPNEIERSAEEKAFRSFMDSAADRVGLGDAVSGLGQTFDDARNIHEASQVAMPAWIAALNGDPSGLAHNIAAGQAAVFSQARTEATDLGPQALAGIVEMAISGASTQNAAGAPFIGEVNSGMTQAELMQTLEHYEMQRARRGTGTTRVR